MNQDSLAAAILARLTAGKPDRAADLQSLLASLPDQTHRDLARLVAGYGLSTDLSALCPQPDSSTPLAVLPADLILSTHWPEPVWAIPGLLPVGLTILAGAPKIGKSWLALQIAQAVASGGLIFDSRVELGPVLYLALEDPPRRLQERMLKQHWPLGLQADFLTIGSFLAQIGDLRNGGGERLARQIERRSYRLVAIDTFSRSIHGDQQDVREMTDWLTPLQEMAHAQNSAIILVDHHKKASGFDQDAIADILGSTAKGAMADTVIGLYRERGKAGAKLSLTGRDVEEKTFALVWDFPSSSWQLENANPGMTPQRVDLIEILASLGPARLSEIAEAAGRNRGNVYKQLAELEKLGRVAKSGQTWQLLDSFMEPLFDPSNSDLTTRETWEA